MHIYQTILGDFDTAYELSQRVLELDPSRIRNWHLGDKAANVVHDEGDDGAHPRHAAGYRVRPSTQFIFVVL